MDRITRFEYITTKAKKTKNSWSNLDRVRFHHFNPNGLVQKRRSMDSTVTQYVNDGIVNIGWHLAYGSLNDYSTESFIELHGKKRVLGFKLRSRLDLLQRDIDRGYTKLAELHMEG